MKNMYGSTAQPIITPFCDINFNSHLASIFPMYQSRSEEVVEELLTHSLGLLGLLGVLRLQALLLD
jgi:hypothetical protein